MKALLGDYAKEYAPPETTPSTRITARFWKMVHPQRHHAETVANILPSFDENNIEERIQTLYQTILEPTKARHPNNPQSGSLCNRLQFIADTLRIELAAESNHARPLTT